MIPRLFSRFLAFFIVVTLAGWSARARAEEARIVVVDVTPAASELGADALRGQIAAELHGEAVKPDDPRAASASGTLTIDVDPKKGDVAITYVARAKPTTRHMQLPADLASARTAVVAIAGNLARDEASELAAELRAKQQEASGSKSASAPAEATEPSDRDAARLQRTLQSYADRNRGARKIVGWTGVVIGSAAAATTFIPATRPSWSADASSIAFLGLTGGIYTLVAKTSLEDLAAMPQNGAGVDAIEQAWAKAAERDQRNRRIEGGGMLFVSALGLGAGTVILAYQGLPLTTKERVDLAGPFYAGSAIGAVLGAYLLATDSESESALRAYEETTGRAVRPQKAELTLPSVAVVPGGAMATLGLRF
jgi:hypothetical protein